MANPRGPCVRCGRMVTSTALGCDCMPVGEDDDLATLRARVEKAEADAESQRVQAIEWQRKAETAEARIAELEAECERLRGVILQRDADGLALGVQFVVANNIITALRQALDAPADTPNADLPAIVRRLAEAAETAATLADERDRLAAELARGRP